MRTSSDVHLYQSTKQIFQMCKNMCDIIYTGFGLLKNWVTLWRLQEMYYITILMNY
jgi:hypothetical protein